jgi:hypothetical protein
MNQIIGTVYKTTDYSQFKILKGNRALKLLHLERLRKSFEHKQLNVPIIVNERFEIIDGQNRFQIIKDLNLPVYFIINEGYGLPEVQQINAISLKWSPEDYLDSYTELGKVDYIRTKEFYEKYNFLTVKMCQILLTGGQKDRYYAQTFKEGAFKITEYDKAIQLAEQMQDFKNYEPFYNSHFQLALITMFNNSHYNHDRMLQKLVYQGSKLTKETRVNDYLKILTEIYNYRANNEEKLYFYQL